MKTALPTAQASDKISNREGVRLLKLGFNEIAREVISTAKGPPTAQKAETMAMPVRFMPKSMQQNPAIKRAGMLQYPMIRNAAKRRNAGG